MKKVLMIALIALLNLYPTGCNTSTDKEPGADTATAGAETTQPQVKWEAGKDVDDKGNAMKVWSPAVLNPDFSGSARRDSLLYWDFTKPGFLPYNRGNGYHISEREI